MALRTKLIVLAAATVALMLAVLTIVQMRQGQRFIVKTAEERVARNIATAWQVLSMRQRELGVAVELLADRSGDLDALRAWRDYDVLAAVDPAAPPTSTVAAAVARRFPPVGDLPAAGFLALEPADLADERPELLARCLIDGEPAATMALFVARRTADGRVLVAADVLTRADELLWGIQRGLFGDEFYEDRRTGTVTIFTGTRRTSTTVLKDDHSSAVGTHVSDEVARWVLEEERSWIGPAVVVGVRYLSRYDPIRQPDGRVIGMLYIGALEERLLDRKHQTVFIGVGGIVAVLLLASLVGVVIYRLEKRVRDQRRRVRFEFLRVLGHELKAPINAVEGYLRVFGEETLGPVPEPYLKMIDRSVARIAQMRDLIGALLDLTRIEAGEKRREVVPGVDLVEVVRASVESVEPDADARGIGVTVEAPVSLTMRADAGELSMICNNLLTNAVKYNHDGGTVTVKLARSGANIVLAVSDTGIGMTADEQAKLFGEFVRIKNDKTRNILGSGLGLNILRKIVDLYGGKVTVASEAGVGTTFTVTLPAGDG